jgi:hypothetical protein
MLHDLLLSVAVRAVLVLRNCSTLYIRWIRYNIFLLFDQQTTGRKPWTYYCRKNSNKDSNIFAMQIYGCMCDNN